MQDLFQLSVVFILFFFQVEEGLKTKCKIEKHNSMEIEW